MNIFASYPCPERSALTLDDVRINKMVVESAQLLSTAVLTLDQGLHQRLGLYKRAYPQHPCTKAVTFHRGTFLWVYEHARAINSWRRETGRTSHKSFLVIQELGYHARFLSFPSKSLWFPNCTTFKHVEDIHEAYRLYLDEKWSLIQPRWTDRDVPEFYTHREP